MSDGAGLDTPLPTEDALARSFGVSRMTAREAYRRLDNEGLVLRRRGRGTFARPPRLHEELERIAYLPLSDQWAMQGRQLRAAILHYDLVPAPDEMAALFDIPIGDPLTRLERLRYADAIPISWDERYARSEMYARVGGRELTHSSLLALSEQHGLPATSAEFTIGAEVALAPITKLLAVSPRSALLTRRLQFFDRSGRVLIAGISKIPAERMGYLFQVTLQASAQDSNGEMAAFAHKSALTEPKETAEAVADGPMLTRDSDANGQA